MGLARVFLSVLVAGLLAVPGSGCDGDRPRPLVVASTTSTEDAGLFDLLIPAFEEAYPGYRVQLVAVGTGQALELGRRKDADVLLVHAPAAESAFVAEGYGRRREPVMHNDFILVGPPADPVGVRGMDAAPEAFRAIARKGAVFVSRGDDSGTHRKERALWRLAHVAPEWDGYVEAGQGMGAVLRVADELGAYTLSDRGTYLFLSPGLALEVLVEGDPRLRNPYGVITVTGAMNPEGADAFADWITGEGQQLIAAYGVERHGRPLFYPNPDPRDGPGS